MSRRIVVDLSDLYSFLIGDNRVSGIQRVVGNFAMRILAQKKQNIVLGYYDQEYGLYAKFPVQQNIGNIEELRNSTRFVHVRRFRPEKYQNRPIIRFVLGNRVRMHQILRRLYQWSFRVPGRPAPEVLPFQNGDIILSLGAGWDATEMFQLVEPVARQETVSLIVLVHDMTPILGVDGRSGLPMVIFEGWLTRAARSTNRDLLVDWDESAEQFLDAVLRLADNAEAA